MHIYIGEEHMCCTQPNTKPQEFFPFVLLFVFENIFFENIAFYLQDITPLNQKQVKPETSFQ